MFSKEKYVFIERIVKNMTALTFEMDYRLFS